VSVKKLEYCMSNLLNNGTDLVFESIKQEFPEIHQSRWACLGNCSECYKRNFVIVDDRVILSAATPEELLHQLREKAKAEE
jgi:uncharacterized protein YuzB (UPF0349 family)